MVQYRQLSPTGDYVFGNNSNDFYTGTLAVAQAILTTLRLYQGEWWEDTSQGFPLVQAVLGLPGTPEHQTAVDMLVQEAVLGVQDVQSISSYTSTYSNRTRRYTAAIVAQSVFGEVNLPEVTIG